MCLHSSFIFGKIAKNIWKYAPLSHFRTFLEIRLLKSMCFFSRIQQNIQKVQHSRILARFGRVESKKNATISHSCLFLLITQYSNCSLQISKKFEPWKKVAPAIKVIVWDCVFLALGSQRPFWELWTCHRLLSRLQFAYFQEIRALEKSIVWDCDFLALGGQRPFWELWKCHRISKKCTTLVVRLVFAD